MDSLRVVIGIDPGLKGAIAVLIDGVPSTIIDMPVKAKATSGNEVDAFALAEFISGLVMHNLGAHIHAVIEAVSTRPGESPTRGQKSAEGAGILKGVLASHGVRYTQVVPQVWKRHHGLLKSDKEASRMLAMAKWPNRCTHFMRVMDHDRAEAALMADWGNVTECWIDQPKKKRRVARRNTRRVRVQPELSL